MCVWKREQDMGPFYASSERNEGDDVIQNECKICFIVQN